MKKRIIRTAALLLALLALLTLPACANTGKTLMTLKADGRTYTFSVNLYEFYLSAVKGNLDASRVTIGGVRASSDKFWNTKDTFDGKLQTVNEHYLTLSQKECKDILIAQYLFDKYELTLPQSETEKIEEYLNELVMSDGDGSMTKLNSVLSTYSVNYDMMREHYTNMARIATLRNHLYSLLGENIKKEFLEENYVHFQQIFLAKYNYVYNTDENGDVIYYNTATSNTVCYKKTNYLKYVDGSAVYYTDDTYSHISYDTEKGVPSYKISADKETYETTPKTEEELKQLATRAENLYLQAKPMSNAQFETAILEESDDSAAAAAYTDGYYLNKNKNYSASDETLTFLDTVVKELNNIEVGEVVKIETETGYHIVKKYALTEKAYDKEENKVWFENFPVELTNRVFAEEAEPYYAQIKIDDAVLAEAKDMKQVAVNYFYYAYK